jgi:hypothetical protein
VRFEGRWIVPILIFSARAFSLRRDGNLKDHRLPNVTRRRSKRISARTSYPRRPGGTEDVEEQDTSHLTIFSADSELSSDTTSEAPESLSNVLRGDSSGGTGKIVQAILVAVFLVLMPQVQCLLSRLADQHRVRCLPGNNARWRSWGREVMWVVRSSISVIRRREQEEERGGALQASLK